MQSFVNCENKETIMDGSGIEGTIIDAKTSSPVFLPNQEYLVKKMRLSCAE
jgi:hypothetical protein